MEDPIEESEIIATMLAYRCTEEIAREKVRYEKSKWSGDVVTIDELNGREEPIVSESLIKKEGI